MKFFRNLFKQETKKVEYVESKPEPEEINTDTLEKCEIKPFLEHSLPPAYWDPESKVAQQEILSISSLSDIEDRLKSLEKSLSVTTNGLFLEVMDHYDSFLSGLNNIQQINILLEQSKTLSMTSRDSIKILQKELYYKYLRIIYLRKRQKRLNGLVNELDSFEELCFAVSLSIKKAIKAGHLYEALELCNEAVVKLRNIDVSKYRALVGIIEVAEKRKGKVYVRMKDTLRELCHKFNSSLYENVLLSYMTIASYDDINKAIQVEFMNSVSRLIKEAIEEAVPHIPASSIESMIKITPLASYLKVSRLILKKLTTLMYNHHLLSRWHEENDFTKTNSYPITHNFIKSPSKLEEVLKFYCDVKLNLLRSRKFIWDKIQTNLAKIINESDQIVQYKIIEIKCLLTDINTFIEIGEDFSGVVGQELKNSINKKCFKFFNSFHSGSWNRMINIIEAEQWTRLPIPKDFEIQSELLRPLQNLRPLSALIESFEDMNFTFSKLVQGNPFDSPPKNYEDEQDDLPKSSFTGIKILETSPVLCAGGLNFLKTAGSYLQLMSILTPITFEVFHSLTQLFEFFLFEIYRIFSNDSGRLLMQAETIDKGAEGEELENYHDIFLFQSKYKNLQSNVVRIKDFLSALDSEGLIETLHKRQTGQFSLAEAIISVSTAKHLLESLKKARQYIDKIIPTTQGSYTDLFFRTQELFIYELEDFIYTPLIHKMLKLEWLAASINSSKWDDKRNDISPYVYRIIHLVEDFKEKMMAIGGGSIPAPIQAKALVKAALICREQVVDCYGKVKRCNLLGREQMRKDYKELNARLEEIASYKDTNGYAEFIDVWTCSADQIYEWALNNTLLSLRVVKNVFLTAPLVNSINKKNRNEMMANIENNYRQRIFN